MNKKYPFGSIVAIGLFTFGMSSAQAVSEYCLDIGGSGVANFVNKGTGIVANLSGSVSTARGEILSSEKTATGMKMKMSHFFMNDSGGFMQTNDDVILTSVEGKDKQFMVNITYHVQKETTSGSLKGYKGIFKSYGLIDMAIGQVIIRYSGEICK